MPEEEPHPRRVDEGTTRLRKEQHSAGCEHAVQLREGAGLVPNVMERLVAEREVDGRIGKLELGDVGDPRFDSARALGSRLRRPPDRARIHVDPDDDVRSKAVLEGSERPTPAATDVENACKATVPAREQPLELSERLEEHVAGPDCRILEPDAEAGLGHVICAIPDAPT
jgi:hypothetical protein